MSQPGNVSPSQIRGALAMLNFSQAELAQRAGVSVETLKRLQGTRAGISVGRGVSVEALNKVRAALESAGVEFTNGNAPGVKLHKAGARVATIPLEDLNAENDE